MMNEKNKETVTRNSNIELLRIICMLCIIVHHFFVHSEFNWNMAERISRINGALMCIIKYPLGLIPCNIFILITGYFMVDKKIKINKLIKLLLETWFYSYIILIIYTICTKKNSFSKEQIISLAPILSEQNWFITCYILLYISIPVLNIIVNNLRKSQLKLLIIIGIVIFDLLPSLGILTNYRTNYLWAVLLYLTGAYIKRYNIKIKYNIYIFIFACAIYNLIFLMGFYKVDSDRGSLILYIMAVNIFIETINNKEISNNFVNRIAASTFGVYLIHENYYIKNRIYKFLNISQFINSPFFFGYVVINTLGMYIICLIIDQARMRLIEKPVMKIVDNMTEGARKKFHLKV